MDCRRMVRSKNFYIMLGITAALLVLLIWLVAFTSDVDTMDHLVERKEQLAEDTDGLIVMDITESDREEMQMIREMSQLDFAQECINSGFLMVIVGIGAALFINADFQSGFIRNICFARPRRRDYVLSKILLVGVYSAALIVLSLLVALVFLYVFGMRPAASSPVEILKYAFWLWLPYWAFGLMPLTLVLLTRSSTLAVVVSILGGCGFLAALVRFLCQKFNWPELNQYMLSTVVSDRCVPMLSLSAMGFILACVLAWAAAYAAASLVLMQKRDI